MAILERLVFVKFHTLHHHYHHTARSFGPAVVTNVWTHHWIWWVGPLIAGVVTPLLYESFFKHFYSVTSGEELKRREFQQSQELQGQGRGEGRMQEMPAVGRTSY